LAGSALAALALPFVFGKFAFSLPALSVIAFFMAIMSRKWENGGIRATSYLVQLYSATALAVLFQIDRAAAADLVNTLPAGLVAIITLYQYQWCRHSAPPSHSSFSRFDPADRSAVALLFCSLASGFFAVRIALLQTLTLAVAPAQVANAFGCGQSILINGSAALIMLFAFLRRNKELRNVAILVTVIGAMKVFLYDLLGAQGVPLVASVFTFGLAPDPDAHAAVDRRVAAVLGALGPWDSGRRYLNFAESAMDPRSIFPTESYDRLTRAKAHYDRTGIFVANHPIARAAAPA
jgi:hypothetical protein